MLLSRTACRYNRQLVIPFQLSFAGLADARQTGLDAILGRWNWHQWSITREEKAACLAFVGRRIVYLTSDSDTLLASVESDTVYIVGGHAPSVKHLQAHTNGFAGH